MPIRTDQNADEYRKAITNCKTDFYLNYIQMKCPRASAHQNADEYREAA